MDTHRYEFPESLLNASISTRLEYFCKKTIQHPRLRDALAKVFDSVVSMARSEITILTGPTGVGKSTLANRLEQRIREHYAADMLNWKDFEPVVHVSAVTPGMAGFNWKDFYIRLLAQLDQTGLQLKLPFPIDSMRYIDEPITLPRSKQTANTLERLVESALRHRGVKAVIIDEANQILTGCSSIELRKQFEVIKSLSIQSGTAIVLIGTYELLQIRDFSAQLCRRSEIVHLPGYSWDDPGDRQSFSSVLNSFQKQMPFPEQIDLTSEAKYFWTKSVGCVGILKDWLDKAVQNALLNNLPSVSLELLHKYAHPNQCLKTIVAEAQSGRSKLIDIPLEELELMLQERPQPRRALSYSAVENAVTKSRRRRDVGKRNPVRDPVGVNKDMFNVQL